MNAADSTSYQTCRLCKKRTDSTAPNSYRHYDVHKNKMFGVILAELILKFGNVTIEEDAYGKAIVCSCCILVMRLWINVLNQRPDDYETQQPTNQSNTTDEQNVTSVDTNVPSTSENITNDVIYHDIDEEILKFAVNHILAHNRSC